MDVLEEVRRRGKRSTLGQCFHGSRCRVSHAWRCSVEVLRRNVWTSECNMRANAYRSSCTCKMFSPIEKVQGRTLPV